MINPTYRYLRPEDFKRRPSPPPRAPDANCLACGRTVDAFTGQAEPPLLCSWCLLRNARSAPAGRSLSWRQRRDLDELGAMITILQRETAACTPRQPKS